MNLANGTAMPSISLSPQILTEFAPSKIFPVDPITSLDYDNSGEFLATTSEDTIRLYSCTNGTHVKHSYSKKYGCSHIAFTHKNTCLLHASTRIDHTIRLLSTHDNKYIRCFAFNTQVL